MPFAILCMAGAAGFLVAVVGCVVIRRFALRHALLDVPNARSLHKAPVPRLGGVGIVAGALTGVAIASLAASALPARDVRLWLAAALVVAATGLADDIRSLRASVRFFLQITIAAAFCLLVGLPAQIVFVNGVTIALPFAVILPLGVVWLVGCLNIYNFMDGMDGLAGAQGAGAGLAMAAAFAAHGHHDLATIALLMAAGCAGFLVQNAPPAKIFMGDAGSTFLGFGFAALALVGAARPDPAPFLVTPLALAPFLLDGTFTIFRRLSRKEAIWEAHRTHLYQRAVGSGLAHHDVLVPYVCWIALASAAAAVTAIAGGWAALGASAAMLGALAITWRWVTGREAAPAEDPAAREAA